MGLPVAAILKTVTALGSAVGVYMARKKSEAGDPPETGGRIIADLQADLHKQTAFIASLTKEVEALTLQVQKLQAAQFWLKVAVPVLTGLFFLLLLLVLIALGRTGL